MKRIKCPKCKKYITFDETKYANSQSLFFQCPSCNKRFGIKLGISKIKDKQSNTPTKEDVKKEDFGTIVVIENIFHYKQIIPLHLGNNIIGRYAYGNEINCPIETTDPSIDTTHCRIKVSKNKQGQLKYELSDGPSNTGTFVHNEILSNRERRIIQDGTLFTIGATSIILRTGNQKK